MKLTLIQLEGRDIGQFHDTFAHILHLTEDSCRTDTDFILLPECAYPGYFIGMAEDRSWTDLLSELKSRLSSLAKSYRKYIAAGLADMEEGRLYNRLLVFGRDGALICSADKSCLWHFDSGWFEAGHRFPVFDTEFGRIGCMICADGRIPEIARCLRLQGAQLILDAVNLVAAAAEPAQLTNQQHAFILPQRSRENGVYIAVCNKCGTENHSVTMLGRSMVTGPDGQILAECGPEQEEILTCEINLDSALGNMGHFTPGHPDYYRLLTAPTETLPVCRKRSETLCLADLEYYTGLVRCSFQTASEYVHKALHYMELCQKADCRLILLPYARSMDLTPWLDELCRAAGPKAAVVIGYGNGQAVMLHDGAHRQLIRPALDERTADIFPGLTVSLTFDQEPEVPENIRICMLQGSDLVIWYDGTDSPYFQQLMQTRAAENRLFMARLTPSGPDSRTLAYNPDGAALTTTFSCEEQVVFGMIYTALSRAKTLVPGTDLVSSRTPQDYTLLTR